MCGVTRVHLQLLGRFQVRRDGEEIPPAAFSGRKVRTLLRVLAIRRPDLVPHDALADMLWPDRLPADPVANLNVLVNRARRAVGEPASIVTGTAGYALGGAVAVDIAEFDAAVRRARSADTPGEVRAAAATALALWGEPLAEDTYAEWARAPRERLHRARVEALELAAAAALELGDAAEAAAAAGEAVAADPLREPAVAVLARALAATGDRAGALRELAALRRRLADELGTDPSPPLQQLQLELLRGSVGVPSPVAAPDRRSAFGGLPFVGRDDELAALRAAVGRREVVAVSGTAGVGKSRLVAEALRAGPLPVITARAFRAERAEAWALARSLLSEALAADSAVADALPARVRGALAWLLPELADSPSTMDGESRRALLLAGGLRVLAAATGQGAVLVVDDLQWADPSSIALLGSVLDRLPQLAVVLAHRSDELDPAMVAGITGSRPVTELALGPLPAPAVDRLADDPALGAALRAATDGTPFAIAEVLRELAARGATDGPAAAALAVELGRDGQRRAVRRRVHRLPPAPAQLLGLVALLAREAPARTLAAAAGQDPRTVLGELSELARTGLLRLGEQGWAPAHDLVGETVAAGLDAGERGRLHGLLAAALEAEGADLAEVARHHRDAGDRAAAAAAYARSAARALDQHATREAGALAEAGLALHPGPPVCAALLDARAESRAAHGDPAGAIADVHTALLDAGGPDRSRRLARLAMLTSGAQDLRRAAELAELAVVEAGDDAAARALALETSAILDMNLDRAERAGTRAQQSLELYRALGDARGVARILDGRAMATFLDGRITEGVALFGRVAQLFEDSGDLLRVVTPRSTRGHGLVFAARAADGLTETDAALRLARELDAPEGQAYALWHRSEALSGLGRTDEAEQDAREALRIARAAGHRGWTATALRALGIARQTAGDLDEAARAFADQAEVAGDALTLFACWAAARSALVAIERGAPAAAEPLVPRALAVGPPLGHHEARLAEVELAAVRGTDDHPALAAAALAAAERAGYAVLVPRLRHLTG
jgi:DNA-binding SARP family transcriptional activator